MCKLVAANRACSAIHVNFWSFIFDDVDEDEAALGPTTNRGMQLARRRAASANAMPGSYSHGQGKGRKGSSKSMPPLQGKGKDKNKCKGKGGDEETKVRDHSRTPHGGCRFAAGAGVADPLWPRRLACRHSVRTCCRACGLAGRLLHRSLVARGALPRTRALRILPGPCGVQMQVSVPRRRTHPGRHPHTRCGRANDAVGP